MIDSDDSMIGERMPARQERSDLMHASTMSNGYHLILILGSEMVIPVLWWLCDRHRDLIHSHLKATFRPNLPVLNTSFLNTPDWFFFLSFFLLFPIDLEDFATLQSPPDTWIYTGPTHPFFSFSAPLGHPSPSASTYRFLSLSRLPYFRTASSAGSSSHLSSNFILTPRWLWPFGRWVMEASTRRDLGGTAMHDCMAIS